MVGRVAAVRQPRAKLRVVVHVHQCDEGHWSWICSECGHFSPNEFAGHLRARCVEAAKGHVGGAHRGRSPEVHVMVGLVVE
jgi:hypothetical protein